METIPEHLTLGKLPQEQRHRLADIQLAASLAANLIILQALCSLPHLDTWTFISLMTLAIAIPTLSGAVVSRVAYQNVGKAVLTLLTCGEICTFISLLTLLGHISWISALLFFLSCFIAANIMTRLK